MSISILILPLDNKRVSGLSPITLPNIRSSAPNENPLSWVEHPLVQVLDSRAVLRILYILLGRPINNKSDESEASTLPRVLVTHHGNINYFPYFAKKFL